MEPNHSTYSKTIHHPSLGTLHIGAIDTPNHPEFENVYHCYSDVFTLPSERTAEEDFQTILSRNPQAAADNSKETWLYVKNDAGEVLGAANFDVFAGNQTQGIDGTIHAIYVFVNPLFREKGIFKLLNEQMHEAACNYAKDVIPNAPDHPNIPIIAEQNAPFRMTAEQYLADNKAAGIDQVIRRVVFEKEGYHTLDCRYIQPPLSEDQEACTYLDMVVKPGRPGETSIPASAIREHLERFFTLSFPPGTTLDHPDIAEMKEGLSHDKPIRLLPGGHFKKLIPDINAEKLASLAPENQDTLLGDLFPHIKQAFDTAMKGNGITPPASTHADATTPSPNNSAKRF